MKILIIGYTHFWHATRIMRDTLRDMKHDVEFLEVEMLESGMEVNLSNDAKVSAIKVHHKVFKLDVIVNGTDFDIVIVGSTQLSFYILNCDKVLYYHTELIWHPSCTNPTHLAGLFPEFVPYFERYYPKVLRKVKDTMFLNHFVRKKDIPVIPDNVPRKPGIHYCGSLFTHDNREWRYRTIYDRRFEVVADLKTKGIIDLHPSNYEFNQYFQEMANWECGLVVNPTGGYNSPRAYEYIACGVVPVFWVGTDWREKHYLRKFGFKPYGNCGFLSESLWSNEDYDDIYPDIESLREGSLELAKGFDAETVLKKVLDWVMME